MEHKRTSTHQFCDTTQYIILDTETGKPYKHPIKGAIFTRDVALGMLLDHGYGWIERYIIVKLECIAGFKL